MRLFSASEYINKRGKPRNETLRVHGTKRRERGEERDLEDKGEMVRERRRGKPHDVLSTQDEVKRRERESWQGKEKR